MAKATQADFASLDKLTKLAARPASKGSKKRNVTEGAREDAVSEALAKCDTPSSVAALASRFGLTSEEITERAKKACNFGQFRMVIGNRMRGVVSKIQAAQKAGVTLSPSDAAYTTKGKVDTKIRNAGKPAKAVKPATKPAPAAKPAPKAAVIKPAPKPTAKPVAKKPAAKTVAA